jgi:hypothetical protein
MRTPLFALTALCLCSLLIPSQSVQAQSDYQAALGARIGTPFGLSGKVFLTQDVAVEGHFGSRRRGFEMGSAALWHRDIGWQGDFNWYFGGGAHIGFSEYGPVPEGSERTETTFGFDGIVGIEYTLRSLPLNLAIDYKPEVNITGVTGADFLSGALSVRYVFR